MLDEFEKGLSEEQIKYVQETGQLPEDFEQSMSFDAQVHQEAAEAWAASKKKNH
jgi:hypothetical protein